MLYSKCIVCYSMLVCYIATGSMLYSKKVWYLAYSIIGV